MNQYDPCIVNKELTSCEPCLDKLPEAERPPATLVKEARVLRRQLQSGVIHLAELDQFLAKIEGLSRRLKPKNKVSKQDELLEQLANLERGYAKKPVDHPRRG